MICTRCNIEKDETEFSLKSSKTGERRTGCKECVKLWRKTYRENNLIKIREDSKKWVAIILKRNKQFVWDYLLNHPCIDCGESNPIVLEFDHRDDVEKEIEISKATAIGWSIPRITKEIDKCDVRCANCHKIRTAKQFGWYKNINTD